MDDATIRELVREVLWRLAPEIGADGARGELIVVLTGATVGKAEAVDQIVSRITSYNVCYTKLLRDVIEAAVKRVLSTLNGGVITSYSIHYTKLYDRGGTSSH